MIINQSLLRNVFFFTILCLYKFLLEWVYFNIVSPYFSYSGFSDYSSNDSCILSWLIFTVFYVFIRKVSSFQYHRPSNIIIFILYLISFVPFTVCIYAGLVPIGLLAEFCLYWFFLLILQNYAQNLTNKRPLKIRVGKFELNERLVKYIGVFSAIIVIYISARYTGFRFHFSLADVYDIRLQAREYNIPTIISYLFAWSKAINPFLFGYCIVKNKKLMAIFYFIIQALNFGIDGMRSTFFMPFLVLFGVLFYKKSLKPYKLKNYIILSLMFLVVISILEYSLLNTYILSSLFIRRLMFIPILIHAQYYDFFTTHVPDYFRSSFLRHFGFTSPYESGVTFTIGWVYTGNVAANSNNGLYSDAIANLGIYGIIIMPLLIVYVLHLLDRCSIGIDNRIVLPLIIWYSYSINNSFFFTVLLTHGLLFLIILMSFLKPVHQQQ